MAPEEHQRVQDALKAQEQGNKRLAVEKKELVKMFDVLSAQREQALADHAKVKHEKERVSEDLSKLTKEVAAIKLERESKESLFEQTLARVQLSLKDEVEAKMCAQKEAQEKTKLARALEDENELLQAELHEEKVGSIKAQQDFEAKLKLYDDQRESIRDQLKEKKGELERNQKKLDQVQQKLEDMTVEYSSIKDQLAEKECKLLEREQEFSNLEASLQEKTGEDQKQLESLLAKQKEDHEAQAGKLKRQNWWMVALQLRVKRILLKQIEEAKGSVEAERQKVEEQQAQLAE